MIWLRRKLEEYLNLSSERRPPRINQCDGPINAAGRETGPARGFSLLELERAGISEERAQKLGIALDRDRCSALGSNVMQLKRSYGSKAD